MITCKRAYEPVGPTDGKRILVDRLWPRGVSKEHLALDLWCKEVAPSDELRKSFHHEADKFPEFSKSYRDELMANQASWLPLLAWARKGDLTLIYAAHDEEHNNAQVLKTFLEEQLQKHG